jgi:hypothetical protein
MEGRAILTLLDRDNEEYVITQPNMYARCISDFRAIREAYTCQGHSLWPNEV